MFGKKFSSNIRRRKRMMISTIILLVVCLGIGYSAFTTDLSIGGTLNVKKYDHTLYGVLEKAAKKGIYAKEYTGEHQDSMAGVGTKEIYHWYGSSNDNGTAITDMNNVIFADHCWQMIRTTDTGGVKMIYNGEPENNQCLSTRGKHVGYSVRKTQSLSTTYYYGTSYTYDKTNNVFSLDGTITTGTIQTGQYTCKQTTSAGTCATLYLVDTLSSGTTYYVLLLDGNSNYSQFGKLQFNQSYNSPAYVGYMYNAIYPSHDIEHSTETMLSYATSLSTTYYYADSYDYNVTNANKYTLTNPYQVTSTNDYTSLVGKYTFKSNSSTYSSTSIYYIAGVNRSAGMMYTITLTSGNNLAYYNDTYTYGDSYIDNGNGTYTITNLDESNPTTIYKSDYYSHYDNMKNKYICKNATNNTCNVVWHAYSSVISYAGIYYVESTSEYKYAKEFSYNSGTGNYTLSNDNVTFWDRVDNNNTANLNNHHYTCWNTTGECSTISYIYNNSSGQLFYIDITGGKNIETVINEMLNNDNINQNNSTMKTGIDAWYKRYMTEYTSQLEDTIFCNDRSIIELNGWNPDGGSLTSYLQFKNVSYNPNSGLSCTNITDKFSVANTKAQLTYPVGLLTSPDLHLLTNNNIRKTGQEYWLASPGNFSGYANGGYVYTSGDIYNRNNVNNTAGVRPAISLKPGTEYVSGTGSMADPYVVEVPMGTLTINYRSDTGTVLHEPLVVTLPIGASYSYKNPVISGYQATESSATGTLSATSKTHVVRYVDSSGPPLVGD